MFARQLATMVEAGLTLSQALRLLVAQGGQGRFQKVMTGVLNDVQDGFSFSNALAKYPDVFDSVFINVVRSGEATGRMEVVLKELAHDMEKDVSIRSKIRGALIYPAFVLFVMVCVAIVMTVKVIPQLKDVFLSSGQVLPASTRFLLAMSDFFINDWYFVILALVIIVIAVRVFLRTATGVRFYSQVSLRLPVLGSIIEEASMARFGRLLGLLLNSGVPLLDALRLVDDSFTNSLQKGAVARVAADVERGIPMSVPITADHLFPPMVSQMVAVGEQTGKMDEVMVKLAEYYESEVDAKVSGLAALVEPVIIIILALGVAWLVQAILLPIYTISTSI